MENHKTDGATALQAEQEEALFECPICGYKAKSKSKIEKHMTCHDNDEEDSSFLCGDCSFQAMNRDQLIEHLETKHEKHICNTCNIACTSKHALNKHIIENHKSHKPCRDYATNSCDYESQQCRYRHIRLKENEHICYTCGVKTKALKDLMTHIKDIHGSQPCTRFAKGLCDRRSRCWYSHRKPTSGNVNISQPTPSPWQGDFQKVPPTSHPQLPVQQMSEQVQNQRITQATNNVLKVMMPTLMQQIIQALKQ
jgi:hypothetical protein